MRREKLVKREGSNLIKALVKYFLNLSMFNKIFYGTILIVLIIITLSSTISYIYLHNERGNEAMDNAVRLVNNINTGFRDNLDQVDKIIMSIYADTGGTGANLSMEDVLSTPGYGSISEEYAALKATKDFFQRLIFLRKDFNSIYIFISQQKNFSYSVNGSNKLGYNPVEEKWFRDTVAADGNTVISVPHIPYQLNYDKKVISFSRLLKNVSDLEVRPDPVVLIDLTLDSINNIIDKVNLSKTTGVMFLDNSGKIVYSRNTRYEQSDLKDELIGKVLKEYNGKFTTQMKDGKYLVAFNTSEITGWKLLTLLPYAEIAKDDRKLVLFSLLLVLLALIIAVFIAFGFSKAVAKPIKRLQKGMAKVKEGDFDIQLEQHSDDELGQLVSSFNSMIYTIKTLIVEKYEERIARNNAEFKYLQAQINPHFIYNTLQTISSMAVVKKVPEISSVSKGLAKILRYSVNTKNKIISIREELENLTCYLDIQKLRFKEFLNYEIDIDEEVLSYGIIKLALQPIVENAITHGIEPKGENGLVKITGKCLNGCIVLEITDNGAGMTKEEIEQLMRHIVSTEEEENLLQRSGNSNIGLRNINFRIKLVYGQEYGLAVDSRKDEGTAITVKIPARQAEGGEKNDEGIDRG